MKASPLISIITITFNAADVITPTMQSIAEQTFRDFEHIIVDGASSDNTIMVARQIGGKDLRIISEPDNGLYDAMNKGLAMACGKYVLFLNAGDAFHSPQTLAAYAEGAKKKPDIIYADTVIVDSNRNYIKPRHLSAPDILTFRSFEKGMLVCHQAFMVKKELAPEYNIDYRFSADFDWCIRCLKKSKPGKCLNLHTVAIDYLNDGLTDKNKIASLKERFDIMRKHYGLVTTVGNHFSFISRALKRNLK
ncbi:MAG: glycosyltransferase [Muribaculaceae bacterium]|nr:glycosyltransferase [Muribaculaceae bacterium]MDE6754650.1 glycosyltransferase [Muribaculaceae bacterium]